MPGRAIGAKGKLAMIWITLYIVIGGLVAEFAFWRSRRTIRSLRALGATPNPPPHDTLTFVALALFWPFALWKELDLVRRYGW